jgi:hypothetical protein
MFRKKDSIYKSQIYLNSVNLIGLCLYLPFFYSLTLVPYILLTRTVLYGKFLQYNVCMYVCMYKSLTSKCVTMKHIAYFISQCIQLISHKALLKDQFIYQLAPTTSANIDINK